MFPRSSKACLIALLFLTFGCTGFAPSGSLPQVEIPQHFSLYQNQRPRVSKDPWWFSLGSPELNRLMDQALKENLTLQESWARLRQSAALLKSRKAGLFPALSAEAGADTSRSGGEDTPETSSDTLSLGMAASYEVDLWGRVNALKEAEAHRVLATRAHVATAAITLSGEVAQTWADLVAIRGEIALVKEQMALNETLLSALELRFQNSLVSAVDVLRQRKVIEQQTAELPRLLQQESEYLNALALLLGLPSQRAPQVATKTLPSPGPTPATGLPADLLAMRPDVRAAGLALKAEEWEVSAARADRLPAISITARARFNSSGGAHSLFDNWLANLAANLTGPIFDAGRRKAEVTRAQAQAEEKLASYKRTVLTALLEVENSLVAETRQGERLEALKKQLITTRLTLKESENRYTRGATDYVTLLGELKELQSLERTFIQEKAQLVKNRIALCRTLGGSWPQTLHPSQSLTE
ncbi:MAG: efflux transporter outer membrane subunit [Desulfobacterales bacterium]|nr:efflux transporter outer membrane subunit [Desulfobacterales bacterium]